MRVVWRRLVAIAGITAIAGALGAVTVSAPAGATVVTDEATFRSAWNLDTQITLGADITLTCGGGGIAVRAGTADFTLDGQGHTITQTCPNNGVLQVSNVVNNAVVENVKVTGGAQINDNGGGIVFEDNGNLTVQNAWFTNNLTCDDGGAIDDEAGTGFTLRIVQSTLSGNSAVGDGGAVWANGGENVVVENSTIAQNQATTNSAAIRVAANPLTLRYATIVQNGLPGVVCPVAAHSAATAKHPHTDVSAQVLHEQVTADPLTAFGSVVALPSGGINNCTVVGGTTSQGYNFSDDTSCGFTGTGDRQSAGDPGLGALGDNGGFAPTQLPQPGSPLIDAIPIPSCGASVGIGTDERGIMRPQGSGCDIGAVEVVVAAPVVVQPKFTG